MKLAELKEKFKHKYLIRVVAGVLTISILTGGAAAHNIYAQKNSALKEQPKTTETADASDAETQLKDFLTDQSSEETGNKKDETVYILADSAGKAKTTIVSAWLKNPGNEDTIKDSSDLSDIENVKGDETFTQTGNDLNWNAGGNDIYYRGTSKKEAPVTETITYFLDGKEISAADLAGKDGNVKIRFDYANHEKSGDVYAPFIVLSGMLLDDTFTNIEVTNGKVVSNGDKNMVMGMAMPGLKESLNLDENDLTGEFPIPDYVEVTADVKNFSLDMTMTVVSGLSEVSGDTSFDLSKLDEKTEDLSSAMTQLKDGSKDLSDGLNTLNEKMGDFSNGISSLQSGIAAYTNGAQTLADGIGTLKGQSSLLISGVSDLRNSVNTLSNGVSSLDRTLNTPMGDQEKASAAAAAQAAAAQAVEAQFANDANPQSYNNIKSQAAAQIEASLTSDAAIASAKQQAADAVNTQAAQIQAQAAEAANAQMQQNAALQGQLQQLSAALQAAGKLEYTQTDAGRAAIAAQAAGMEASLRAAGFSDEQLASLQTILSAAATANVIANDGNAQGAGAAAAESAISGLKQAMASGAGQAAVAAAQSVAPQTAEATVRGVAQQAKSAISTSMADNVKAAAKTSAEQAASQAAVQAAESTKKQIAQAIEKKDAKSGHSLVSGMSALNTAVEGMFGKMPKLSDGIDQLYNGSQTLTSKNAELNNGASKLNDGKDQLALGVFQLKDGAGDLKDGIVKFDEEGIEKLLDLYNGDVKDLTDRIEAVLEAGKSYDSFTGKAKDASGAVTFIIKTDEIKPEEN